MTWLSPSPVIKADHVVLRCDRAQNDHKGGTMLSLPTCMNPYRTAVVYRSPSVSMLLLLQHMTQLLGQVGTQSTVIMGDFNDDVFHVSGSVLEQFMLSQGYTQLVRQSTSDRATLIDHVYFSEQISKDVVVQVRHDAVYCSVPLHYCKQCITWQI